MTPHSEPLKSEVGVRELHDRLSRYVQHVKDGAEVVVTMRGRRVARLVPVDEIDPLADLRARGLVREPTAPPARATSTAQGRRAGVRPRGGSAALIVYFDTSALIKLIFDQPGSELAVEVWDRADVLVSSQLVYPEARAALVAAARGGRIGKSTHTSAVATLEDLYAQLRTVAIDEPLARHAGELAAQHALRGYDAVQLACALALEGDDILLATWDDALNAAARATGRLIANDTD